ncbi:MAG TPA: hypothetical protein VGB68_05040, partial [Pyrinomonadaceae bacterium]
RYETIDSILNNWANKRNLHLYKNYKDEEVRSFEIVNTQGDRYQIWVDAPDEKGQIGIYVWDYKKRRKDFIAQEVELFEKLESAFSFTQLEI